MAANLDNFFAKKDKKKKGKTKGYAGTSPAVMAKTLENLDVPTSTEPEKKPEFQIDLPSNTADEDEWHEVAEQTQDLEGLKIRSLRAEESEEATEKQGEKNEPSSDNEETTEATSASPWQPVNPPPPEPTVEVAPDIPLAENIKKTNAYIPPNRRNLPQGEGLSRVPMGGHLRRGKPPDIQSNIAFPSLGSSEQK